MNPKSIEPAEQLDRGRQLREDALRLLRVAVRLWDHANRIDPAHHQTEGLMSIETTIITAYQKKIADTKSANDTLTKANSDLTGQVNTLQQQLTSAQASAKDATDLQTEQSALQDLGLDAAGNPVASVNPDPAVGPAAGA